MENLKRDITFLDANGKRARVEITITDRNGYPEFTMSGSIGGAMGQVREEIRPASDAQRELLGLWSTWHLNGMHAGTPEQEQAVAQWRSAGNSYAYSAACERLKRIGLYTVPHPVTGEPYDYGSGWLRRDLPENMPETIRAILRRIEAEEAAREEAAPELSGDDKLLADMAEESIGEDMLDAVKAYITLHGEGADLSDFSEAYVGEYDSDADFAEEFAGECGMLQDGMSWPYTCIDWEQAARELMMDHSEEGGYYFRDL